jgi:hypothetical protein
VTERIDLDPADAPWVSTLVRRIYAARAAGDTSEAERLLEYGRAEGGETLSRIVDQLLNALDRRDTAKLAGETMTPYDVSAVPDGALICDFCAATGPVVYYEVTEFSIMGPGGEFLSGDRFYACPACRRFVDTSDWKGLRAWIGPAQFGLGHRMLLVGFRQHRKGSAVEFPPGTNPEANR